MSSETSTQDKLKEKSTARLVLFSLIGFFVVFCTVDIFFVYKAVSTNTGVVTEKSYQAGLAFDHYAEEARDQVRFETHSTLIYENGLLDLYLADDTNLPITAANVTGQAMHMINGRYDLPEFSLTETGPGLYEAPLTLAQRGLWTIKVTAKWNDGETAHLYQKKISVSRP